MAGPIVNVPAYDPKGPAFSGELSNEPMSKSVIHVIEVAPFARDTVQLTIQGKSLAVSVAGLKRAMNEVLDRSRGGRYPTMEHGDTLHITSAVSDTSWQSHWRLETAEAKSKRKEVLQRAGGWTIGCQDHLEYIETVTAAMAEGLIGVRVHRCPADEEGWLCLEVTDKGLEKLGQLGGDVRAATKMRQWYRNNLTKYDETR